ncbi:hypothetical protein RISK_005358 [Rhodopirellula islandica]|uniref:Uncharacterized protein n=1 Tax=Rhodopirellula islandica TaxID=595434 RepID=A0A0J1B6D2_RHOIS|nr:hypothetical protein RISK_005358 [Rhodopirellula islandica]
MKTTISLCSTGWGSIREAAFFSYGFLRLELEATEVNSLNYPTLSKKPSCNCVTNTLRHTSAIG